MSFKKTALTQAVFFAFKPPRFYLVKDFPKLTNKKKCHPKIEVALVV